MNAEQKAHYNYVLHLPLRSTPALHAHGRDAQVEAAYRQQRLVYFSERWQEAGILQVLLDCRAAQLAEWDRLRATKRERAKRFRQRQRMKGLI